MQPSLPFDVPASPSTPHRAPSAQHLAPSTWHPSTPHSTLFVRHPRARRYVIRVQDDGRVRVTIPRGGSKREAQAFAQRQHGWIEKQRRRIEAERQQRNTSGRPAGLEGERAQRDRANVDLPARLLELAARHGLAVSRISIRNQKWRWGSCSRRAHICLNWRLIDMPHSVRDYVMIHELMHLKRMDHSPRFWKLVAQACPDYQHARRWLRAHALRSHA